MIIASGDAGPVRVSGARVLDRNRLVRTSFSASLWTVAIYGQIGGLYRGDGLMSEATVLTSGLTGLSGTRPLFMEGQVRKATPTPYVAHLLAVAATGP
jgi:hypothetical protein